MPAPDPNLVVAADLCGNIGITKAFVSDAISNQLHYDRYTITRTYSATDICGNGGTCVQIITVNDNVAPIALCKNLTVSLDPTGTFRIKSKDLDNGSSDNCGIGNGEEGAVRLDNPFFKKMMTEGGASEFAGMAKNLGAKPEAEKPEAIERKVDNYTQALDFGNLTWICRHR